MQLEKRKQIKATFLHYKQYLLWLWIFFFSPFCPILTKLILSSIPLSSQGTSFTVWLNQVVKQGQHEEQEEISIVICIFFAVCHYASNSKPRNRRKQQTCCAWHPNATWFQACDSKRLKQLRNVFYVLDYFSDFLELNKLLYWWSYGDWKMSCNEFSLIIIHKNIGCDMISM